MTVSMASTDIPAVFELARARPTHRIASGRIQGPCLYIYAYTLNLNMISATRIKSRMR